MPQIGRTGVALGSHRRARIAPRLPRFAALWPLARCTDRYTVGAPNRMCRLSMALMLLFCGFSVTEKAKPPALPEVT